MSNVAAIFHLMLVTLLLLFDGKKIILDWFCSVLNKEHTLNGNYSWFDLAITISFSYFV